MWMTRVAINNPVFAAMVMVALCVLGLFSYARLGVEQMPDVPDQRGQIFRHVTGACRRGQHGRLVIRTATPSCRRCDSQLLT